MTQRTECGSRFEHDRHPFENADGLVEICTGEFAKSEFAKSESAAANG